MSVELRHLQEQRDAFDALADALGTPDSWLSYRAKALHDQLQECERQAAVRPSTLERICTALIDRDEALQQARGVWRGCARWRPTRRRRWSPSGLTIRSSTRGSGRRRPNRARLRRGRAEQKAKEADELKATLDAKVAALATAEDQLLQERAARQGAEG
jgi:hypothetical protein